MDDAEGSREIEAQVDGRPDACRFENKRARARSDTSAMFPAPGGRAHLFTVCT